MTRAVLLFVVVGMLPACSVDRFVRNNVVPDCPGHYDRATSRAAACMTAALYDIARSEHEDSSVHPSDSQDEGDGPSRDEVQVVGDPAAVDESGSVVTAP